MTGLGLEVLRTRMFPHGHPLVRPIDRFEARLVPLFVLLAVLAIPLALTVGSSVSQSQLTMAQTEANGRTETTATVLEDAPAASVGAAGVQIVHQTLVNASWRAGGLNEQTGVIQVPPGTLAGTEMTIWIDANGEVVPAPRTSADAVHLGVLAGIGFWIFSLVVLSSVYGVTHAYANHRRSEEWDRALKSVSGL